MSTEPSAPHAYTTSEWAGAGSQRWAAHADRLEAQLEPVSEVLFAAAGLRAGARVLDVGCGRGTTTRRAARLVGPAGTATGLDVAAPLIAEGRAAAALEGVDNVEWVVADAQRHRFAAAHHQALISRFGVMFFDDPVAAFANLHTAVQPGGALTMAVWQRRDRCPLFEVPLAAGRRLAQEQGLAVDDELPTDAGPSSLGDAQVVSSVLEQAGWREVVCTGHILAMYSGGPGPVEAATDVAMEVGPLRLILAAADPRQRAAVRAGLLRELAAHHDGTGVRLDGAILLVQAVA